MTSISLKGVLGLGAVSTNYFLRRIHEKFRINHEEFSTCPLLLYQIDFQELNPFLPNNFEALVPKLNSYLNDISNLGISKLLIPNITLHETVDQINLPIDIIHPVELTVNFLKEKKIEEAFIFGTSYTMNSQYLKKRFLENNILLIVPDLVDQNRIDEFRKKVYSGIETAAEIIVYKNLINKYSEKNLVLIACTELSLYSLIDQSKCVDMAELQIEAFLK